MKDHTDNKTGRSDLHDGKHGGSKRKISSFKCLPFSVETGSQRQMAIRKWRLHATNMKRWAIT